MTNFGYVLDIRDVFNKSPDLMAVITREAHAIEIANTSLRTMLGYPEDHLIQKDFLSFVETKDRTGLVSAIKSAEPFYRVEVQIFDRDGMARDVSITGSVLSEQSTLLTARDITDEKNSRKELYKMAHFDSITGLPNRYLFEDRVQQGLAQTKRESRQAGIIFIDLDGFKLVNDTYGHEVGDFVIQTVSTRLANAIRDTDTVSRFGGDEFCVFLPMLQSIELIDTITARLGSAIEKDIFHPSGCTVSVGSSCGSSVFSRDGDNMEELLRCADKRMYTQKMMKKRRITA